MQTQILVPLDGSPLAELIVPHARIWAHATGSRLTLFQVIAPPAVPDPLTGAVTPGSVPYHTWEARHRQAQTYLAAVAQTLATTQQAADVVVREGEPATQIVAYAAGEPGVTGIAMATRGWGGWEGWVLGSQAEQVLHNAPRPLLLVRPQREADSVRLPPARPYHTIVVPLDGSPQAERALPPAQALAAATGARLRLVTALPEPGYAEPRVFARLAGARVAADSTPETYLAQLAGRVQMAGGQVETALVVGNPAEAIAQYSDTVDADLVVMATHGPRGVDRLWHASVAARLLELARPPILLVRT
jgi:nucleotide-binding universal stress UspA family protein